MRVRELNILNQAAMIHNNWNELSWRAHWCGHWDSCPGFWQKSSGVSIGMTFIVLYVCYRSSPITALIHSRIQLYSPATQLAINISCAHERLPHIRSPFLYLACSCHRFLMESSWFLTQFDENMLVVFIGSRACLELLVFSLCAMHFSSS